MTTDRFWSDKRVFVTGGTGLLGAWLADELVARGAHVVALIRDLVPESNFFRLGLDRAVTCVRGAIEDYAVLARCLAEYEIDTVFHLAAQAIVGVAQRHPLATFEANVRGTWNVLEACRQSDRVARVVVASSDKAYGAHDRLPYDEQCALRGTHPYDVSKSCADLIATAYHRTYGLPVCVTRCGNLFGGGDLNFNRLIPGTIRAVLNGERPLLRSDGTPVRDYLYVKDAVHAYLLVAGEMGDRRLHGEAFNFSVETPLSVLAVTEKILACMGREDLAPVIVADARGEIQNQYLSAAKAKSVLGWRPTYSIDAALAETVEWYRLFFRSTERRAAR